jgi:acyl-CoA synthetase (AMP-forming)/AMP-acid ligase II
MLSSGTGVTRVNVGDMLTRTAARYPERPALADDERRITYRAFNAWVNRVANGLAELGYKRGAALALMSGNSMEFLVTYYACAKLGVVCVPVNLFWRGGELAYVLRHAGISGVAVAGALLDQLQPALAELSPIDVVVIGAATGPGHRAFADFERCSDAEPQAEVGDRDPLSYLYTSGTTSAPKGVVSSHLAVYLQSLGNVIETRLSAADTITALLPMFHTAQLNALCTTAVAVGAGIRIVSGFEPAALLDLIAREHVSVVFALPMMYRALLAEQKAIPRDLSSLRLAIYAMAPMPQAELAQMIELLGCEFSLMFGQTEMSPTATFFRPEHQLSHPGAVGTPCINVQVGIMDAEGRLLPPTQVGEIVYRSPQVMTEYLRDPAATKEVFRHGWFHSGDSGYFGEDGILWFLDRYKDVIKTGGENVASIEVEKALFAAEPNIADVAVVGLPHPKWTEAVTAVIVPKQGGQIDPEALLELLKTKLSPFKCPKSVLLVNELPRTATGKIQKAMLRKQYADHYVGADR